MSESPFQISEIEIVTFRPKRGHLGFAIVQINNQFRVADIAIFSRPEGGIRLGYPKKPLANGQFISIFKPLSREVDEVIENAIVDRYEALVG